MSKPLKQCKTPKAFRKALEERLRNLADKQSVNVVRLYRQIAYDRLLSRIFRATNSPYLLIGGYAMELRMHLARATIDIDLSLSDPTRLTGSGENNTQIILENLQDGAAVDLQDFFEFTISGPVSELSGAPEGGARFLVEANMDQRGFVKFHLDIGIGDAIIQPIEWLQGRDWLEFAGIPSIRFPAISQEQHFAEKLHAYTRPRSGQPSRVKDLIDMVLFIQAGTLNPQKVAEATTAVFKTHRSHEVPKKLQPPPESWTPVFAALAKECQIAEDITKASIMVENYFAKLTRTQ
jgi:hypothetical protein